jgi:glycosyltransferase involved in cell wall biosynthesis
MKIGFDISQTGKNKAGCGYYAYQMLMSLIAVKEESTNLNYELFTNFGDFYFDPAMFVSNDFSNKSVIYRERFISKNSASNFWNHDDLNKKMINTDIIHSNNFWCPNRFINSKIIYTLYDLGFLINPNWTTEANRIGCFEGIFRASIYADYIVAISEYSKNHFISLFPSFPCERIRVIYPSSRFNLNIKNEFINIKKFDFLKKEKFWLCVGTIEPRKNHITLIKSYVDYLTKCENPYPLVIAGGKGWLMDDIHIYINKLNISDLVHFVGYVDDDELSWLYSNCFANIYPSHFEGFGLPVLEGFQFSAATICSDNSSIKEITKDSALLFNSNDEIKLTQLMLDLSNNDELHLKYKHLGNLRFKEFSWKQSANKLVDLYTEAFNSPKKNH